MVGFGIECGVVEWACLVIETITAALRDRGVHNFTSLIGLVYT